MSSIDRLLKKRPRQLHIDEDVFWVRSMSIAETQKADELGDKDKFIPLIDFVLSRCVVEEDGQPVFTGEEDERIHEIPTDVAHRLVEEIRKATRPASEAAIVKN